MSRIGDFFRMLASNPNVVDDEKVNEELAAFLAENSDSTRRVSQLEKSLSVDSTTKKKLNIVSGGKADGLSKKREARDDLEEELSDDKKDREREE